jgi:hypothetical protein
MISATFQSQVKHTTERQILSPVADKITIINTSPEGTYKTVLRQAP